MVWDEQFAGEEVRLGLVLAVDLPAAVVSQEDIAQKGEPVALSAPTPPSRFSAWSP